jgi:hypothetical protein
VKSLITIAFLLLAPVVWAQSFVARLSKSTLAVGENFQITFEYQGDGSRFSPPNFDNFAVLAGPNKSSNMQWINGNFSSSVSYSFVLRAMQEGTFTIGAATLTLNGKSVETEALEVTVVKGRTARQAPPPQTAVTASKGDADLEDELNANIFLKLFVNKKEAYVGEQLLATYKLYLNASIVDYNFGNLVFNGFFAEDLQVDATKNVSTEVINGRQFSVYTLKQTLLTPQKSGEIEIPALETDMVVRVRENKRRRSIFDDVFGSFRNVQLHTQSNVERIHVLPLPTANQPAEFNGAVGEFKLLATADRDKVAANEAINLTITVEGNGNLELVPPPAIQFPTDFETYDPKIKNNLTPTVGGTKGTRTYEYVLIPRYPGDYTLEGIRFAYFDPKSKSYKHAQSDNIVLTVGQTTAGNDGSVAMVATKKEDVQIIGKDIRFISLDPPHLKRKEDSFYGSALFYGLTTLPFAGMGATIFLVFFLRAQQENQESVKRKRAKMLAKKQLSWAKKALQKDESTFYEAISQALFGYLSDKLTIQRSELHRDRIQEELLARNVSETLRHSVQKTLDECEMVRFAPGVVSGKEEMLANTTQLIAELEDEL